MTGGAARRSTARWRDVPESGTRNGQNDQISGALAVFSHCAAGCPPLDLPGPVEAAFLLWVEYAVHRNSGCEHFPVYNSKSCSEMTCFRSKTRLVHVIACISRNSAHHSFMQDTADTASTGQIRVLAKRGSPQVPVRRAASADQCARSSRACGRRRQRRSS